MLQPLLQQYPFISVGNSSTAIASLLQFSWWTCLGCGKYHSIQSTHLGLVQFVLYWLLILPQSVHHLVADRSYAGLVGQQTVMHQCSRAAAGILNSLCSSLSVIHYWNVISAGLHTDRLP